MTLRRYAPLKQSRGTVWPADVREHIATHQPYCIGPLAGMPGECVGASELDHIRASHGTGMKSDSIATNGARLCSWHHYLKGQAGKIWRPRLITVVRSLFRGCERCETEDQEVSR
jgi:hypothetical protein